jgi:hypothetical protein
MLMPPSPMQLPTQSIARGSNAFQILNQILLVCVAEVEFELRIVVVHHVEQRGEASIVEETALLMRPQPCERCGAVHVGRRAVGLERVDSDLGGRVHVVSRLGVERRYVAGRTLARTVEDRLSAFECGLVV